MLNIGSSAPLRAHKIVVVGFNGCQYRHLSLALSGFPIDIHEVSPDKLLRKSHFDCPVFLTKFVGHKHSWHAEKIAPHAIWVRYGSPQAVADEILKYFHLAM